MDDIGERDNSQLVEAWSGKFSKWNLQAKLTSGDLLPGGKIVNKDDIEDHGTDFQINPPLSYNGGLQRTKSEHPEANIITVFSRPDNDVIRYHTRVFRRPGKVDIRSGYLQAYFDFQVPKGDGTKFLSDLRINPGLMNSVIGRNFPNQELREDLKQVVIVPENSNYQTVDDLKEVIN